MGQVGITWDVVHAYIDNNTPWFEPCPLNELGFPDSRDKNIRALDLGVYMLVHAKAYRLISYDFWKVFCPAVTLGDCRIAISEHRCHWAPHYVATSKDDSMSPTYRLSSRFQQPNAA